MISKNGRPKFAQKVKVAREQLNGHARARETAERLRRPTSFSGIICSQYFFLLLSFSFYLDLLKKLDVPLHRKKHRSGNKEEVLLRNKEKVVRSHFTIDKLLKSKKSIAQFAQIE